MRQTLTYQPIGYQLDNLTLPVDSFNIAYNNEILYSYPKVMASLRRYSVWYCIKDIATQWLIYINTVINNLYKAFSALNATYNPIENYLMTEIGTDTSSDGETIFKHKSDPEGSSISTTSTQTYNVTNSRYVTTYDNITPRLESYTNSQTGSFTGSQQPINTYQTVYDKTSYIDTTSHNETSKEHDGKTFSGDKVETHDFKRNGNIGVTTSQQMIESEISLRMKNLLDMYVDGFIANYCWYGGNTDDIEIILE